jgi:hypothetical protein
VPFARPGAGAFFVGSIARAGRPFVWEAGCVIILAVARAGIPRQQSQSTHQSPSRAIAAARLALFEADVAATERRLGRPFQRGRDIIKHARARLEQERPRGGFRASQGDCTMTIETTEITPEV